MYLFFLQLTSKIVVIHVGEKHSKWFCGNIRTVFFNISYIQLDFVVSHRKTFTCPLPFRLRPKILLLPSSLLRLLSSFLSVSSSLFLFSLSSLFGIGKVDVGHWQQLKKHLWQVGIGKEYQQSAGGRWKEEKENVIEKDLRIYRYRWQNSFSNRWNETTHYWHTTILRRLEEGAVSQSSGSSSNSCW